MKTIRYFILLIFSAALGIGAVYAGSSDKTETRTAKNFNAIKVSTGIDLYLLMGNSEEVKIVADEDIIDRIITKVEDGTLHIYMKNSNFFNWGFNKSRKAYVSVKELEKLHASSGSDVFSENTLQGETLEIKASSGSDVKLDVIYKNLSIDASSGSDAKITGKAKTFEAEASSGSDIVAGNLECVICKVKASSGSDATVNVSDELYARVSSGADVRYYGNPAVKNIDESSGGDVKRK